MEYHNPTLRVLRILELIDAHSGGLSLSEISNLLTLPKGTISPILKTARVPLSWGFPMPAARTRCPLSAVKCAALSPR